MFLIHKIIHRVINIYKGYFKEHENGITSLAVNPYDKSIIATGQKDIEKNTSIYVWNSSKTEPIVKLTSSHLKMVRTVLFFPDIIRGLS